MKNVGAISKTYLNRGGKGGIKKWIKLLAKIFKDFESLEENINLLLV